MSFTTPFSFGSPAPSAFGATTPQPSAFGGSTFGGTSTTGFGTTGGTSFGTTPQSTFPSTSFGGTTGTTGGFGFGQPTTGASTFGSTTPSTSGFGFGSTASPSPFGATTQQPASSSVFGSTTQSPFGAPTTGTTGGSMFGSTTPANPFGATPSTTTFGATTPSTTGTSFGFGGTSSFGTTGTTTSAFGAPTTQSAFGSTPAFGAPSTGFAGSQTGTAVAKYAETAINENNQMVKFLTITAMEQYKNKSNEELRWEDYQRIKSGGGQFGTAATGATTTFGATTPSTGFGGFGTTTTAAPATSFSFGSSAPTTSAFGTTPTTQPSTTFGTSFGTTPSATTGTSPFSFGGSTGTTGTSLRGTTFGATTGTSGTSPFSFGGTTGTTGATSTPSAFSFGGTSSTPATSQPSAFSFGGTTGASTSQPAAGTSPFSFGGTTGTSGSAPSTFSFGGTTGTSQPSGSSPFSFGGATSTPSTGSSTFSFGNIGSSTGANMFGTGQTGGTTPGFGTSSFSFGGTSTPSTTSGSNLFGFGGTPGTTTPSTGSGMFNFGGSTGTPQTGATSSSLFGSTGFGAQNTTQANVQIPMPSINSTPFGPPPLVIPNPGNVNTSTTATTQPPMTPVGAVKTARIAVTPHYKMTPRSATKLKPRGFTGKLLTPESEGSSSMEAREADHLFVPRQSIKKLDIESSTVDESPLFNREKRAQLISGVAKPEDSAAGRRVEDASRSIDSLATPQRTPRLPDTPFVTSTPSNQARGRPSIDLEQSNLNFSVDSGVQSSTPARATSEGTPVKASDLPKISKPGYYSSPSLAEMRASTVEALRAVKDFTVGCEGVGSVRFLGETDVRRLAIDDLVIFHNKEIEVYPDESKKPPVGHELNKPAVLTLQKCFPKDKSGKRLTAPEDISRFENKLKHQTQKFGGRFISYKADAGEWSFRVEHFSRYGLDEDDEDDDEEKAKQPQKPLAPLPANAKQAPLLANAKQAPQTNKPLVKPQPVRATAPPQTASSDDASMNGSEEDYEEEQQLRDARYRNEEYEEDEEEEEFDSREEMQDEYDEEEEEYDEYEDYQAQPARMRYESTSSQDLGSDDVEQEPEYVSPTRRTTGQMVPEQLGLNPAKIQVMKSLLFQDETPQGNASKRRRMDREGPSPAAFTPSRVERPRREITPVFQVMKEQSPVAPAKAAPIVVTKQRAERVAIPLAKSVVHQHTDGLKDAGLFMSRSFRVGWGPGGVLFRLAPTKRPTAAEPSNFSRSSVIETAVGKENPPTFSTIVMERINPVPELGTVEHARQFYLPFLENHLNKTSPEQQPHSDIPQLRIGENFDDFVTSTILTLEQLKSNQLPTGQVGFDIPSLNLEHYISVWKLIKALWGKHSLDVPFELEEDARRHYLSMWLKDAVLPTVKEELSAILKNKSPFANEESNNAIRLRAVFSSLTGKKVKEAVDLAIENKDYRFAMLLAQAANNEEFNNAVRDQLAQWRKSGADKTIEHERMALYKLLAAEVDSVSGSLDWKRAFGLQLWYGQPSTSSIGQVVSAFEHAVVKGHARKPLPIYKPYKDYKPQKVEGSLKFTENFDTNFHVLRLYSDRNHPWHQAMHPLNNSHNIQDYWMSWNLFSALSALNLFGNSTHNGRDYVFELGMSFASQLEMCGLWEWAIYVIYNLPETYPNIRERAVRAILSRYVTDIETLDQEQFLRQRLNLPVEWIEEAKSWRAMSRGKLNDAVWHMINSRQYESAHHLIVTALASKYILNEAYNEELFNVLDTLGRHVNHLIDWENRGGMYYDYLGVEKEFKHCQETLRHTEDSAAIAEVVARLSSLEQFVASLSKRLAVWVAEDNNELAKKGNNGGKPSRRRDWLSNDLFDRVCLAEMSTRLSQYGVAVKQLLTDNQPHADLNLMTDVNHFTAELSANGLAVAHRLKELAIPEDYRLTQLNDLCANFLSSLQQVA